MRYKIPVSTLVLVYTPDFDVLLIERADFPGHWQSVTGSQEPGETLAATATRELREETGIDAHRFGGVVDWSVLNRFEIFPKWRHRYAPGTTHNTEHVFALEVPSPCPSRSLRENTCKRNGCRGARLPRAAFPGRTAKRSRCFRIASDCTIGVPDASDIPRRRLRACAGGLRRRCRGRQPAAHDARDHADRRRHGERTQRPDVRVAAHRNRQRRSGARSGRGQRASMAKALARAQRHRASMSRRPAIPRTRSRKRASRRAGASRRHSRSKAPISPPWRPWCRSCRARISYCCPA